MNITGNVEIWGSSIIIFTSGSLSGRVLRSEDHSSYSAADDYQGECWDLRMIHHIQQRITIRESVEIWGWFIIFSSGWLSERVLRSEDDSSYSAADDYHSGFSSWGGWRAEITELFSDLLKFLHTGPFDCARDRNFSSKDFIIKKCLFTLFINAHNQLSNNWFEVGWGNFLLNISFIDCKQFKASHIFCLGLFSTDFIFR